MSAHHLYAVIIATSLAVVTGCVPDATPATDRSGTLAAHAAVEFYGRGSEMPQSDPEPMPDDAGAKTDAGRDAAACATGNCAVPTIRGRSVRVRRGLFPLLRRR